MMGRGVRPMRALAKRPCASGRHGELRQACPPSMIDPGPESQVPGMGGLRSGIGRQSTRPGSVMAGVGPLLPHGARAGRSARD